MSPTLEYDQRFCFVAFLSSGPEYLSAMEVILLIYYYFMWKKWMMGRKKVGNWEHDQGMWNIGRSKMMRTVMRKTRWMCGVSLRERQR